MGDPISVTGGIISVATVAAQSCSVLYKTFWALREASAEAGQHVILFKGLQTVFASILELEAELLVANSVLTPEFVGGIQRCLVDLEAAELILRPITQALDHNGKFNRMWARIKWTSHDRQRLRLHLQSLEAYRKVFALELSLLNIRISLKRIAQEAPSKPKLGGAEPFAISMPNPGLSPAFQVQDVGSISIQTMMMWYIGTMAWSFLLWLGPVRKADLINEKRVLTTRGYGVAFATSCLARLIAARIELSIYVYWTQMDRQSRLSLQWSLRTPQIIIGESDNVLKSLSSGDVLEFQQCLSDADISINDVYRNGETFLHHAVYQNQYEMALYLLRAGALVNAVDGNGLSPLHVAVMYGSYDVARVLLDHGADLENCSIRGRSPLHCRFSNLIERIIRLHGEYLDVTIRDENSWTLLHHLAFSERAHWEMFAQLHRTSQTDLKSKDSLGKTVFHLAGACCSLQIMAYLLGSEDVSDFNEEGVTSCLAFSSRYDALQAINCIGHWLKRFSKSKNALWAKGDPIPTINQLDGQTVLRSIFGEGFRGSLQSLCVHGNGVLQIVDAQRKFRSTWIFESSHWLWFFEANIEGEVALVEDFTRYFEWIHEDDRPNPPQKKALYRFLQWYA